MLKKIIKKGKYTVNVFYWFVWYNLVHGESKKVWHLVKSLTKHVILGTPYALILETGNTCNFNCATCPTPRKLVLAKRPPELMSLEKFKKVIDQVKSYVHIVYLYNSNEPLLNPQIGEMIRYASDNHLHTMISTNCSLLDEIRARKILDSGLGEIRFALDGLTKESFEQFRVGGNFETVKTNIENFCRLKQELGKKRPIATLQFILNKLNQDQIPDIKKFAKENKIDKLYIKPFILGKYAYREDDLKRLSDNFLPDKDIESDEIVYKKDEQGLAKPKAERKMCPDVKRIFTVLSDGRASMCCFDLMGDYIYGDLGVQNFKEIWNSERALAIRNAAHNRKLPLCKVCGNVE